MAEGAVSKNKYFFDELNSWTQSGFTKMVRKGDWKLIFNMEGNSQLYNLPSDPMELENLFDVEKYTPAKVELLQELLKWEKTPPVTHCLSPGEGIILRDENFLIKAIEYYIKF